MSLQPGSRIGSYEIVSALGAGGMGEVYRARDTKLNRDVAIKVLPEAFALDADRLARFTREAQVLATLNHPNIAQVYSVEGGATEGGGPPGPLTETRPPALVMELVEGEDLSALIALGAMPLADALPVAKQIADAIEAAHEQGIVHRDLKPANIKVRPDGTVKVLDFGLAKAMDPQGTSGVEPMNSPTMTARATQMGMIIGTAAYMAPEQAKGRAVDKRADIWAFGVVLHEMLTGQRLFEAEDVSETLAAVLTRDVSLPSLPASIPARLRVLMRDCLVRDPRQRLRDIGDARRTLEQVMSGAPDAVVSETTADGAPVPRTASLRSPRFLATAALLVALGAAAGIGLWNIVAGGAAGDPEPVRLSISIPPSIHAMFATIVPDGRTLIVFGVPRDEDGTDAPRTRLYTRPLGDYAFTAISGTDGVRDFMVSPDGTQLVFVATLSAQSSQRRIAKVPVDGSAPPVTIADWDDDWSESVAWLEDGDLLVATSGGSKFFRLPTGGGAAKPPVDFDTGSIRGTPVFGTVLPGDRGVFFGMESWGLRGYQMDQWLLDPDSGKAERVFENAGSASYSDTGHIVFTRGPVLMAAPFDLDTLTVTGDVTAFPGSVRTEFSWSHGPFKLSSNGTLVSPEGGRLGTDRTLVLVDATGREDVFTAEPRAYETNIRVSPDGRKAAVIVPNAKGTYETWVADLDRPGLRRVLMLPNADSSFAVWSPRGDRLAYSRTARDAEDGIYVQRTDGTGSPQVVLKVESQEVGLVGTSWAPNGSGVLVTRAVGGRADLLFVPVSPDGEASEPRPLRATPANESAARFSPDGRFVAFTSDESGRDEVYVASYGADGTLGAPMLVSANGGSDPAWTADSRRVFYFNEPDKVMSVTLSVTPELSASAPVAAYDLRKLRVNHEEWDIMPDGRLLAIQKGQGEDDITVFNVVLNWFSELRARTARRDGQ